MKLSASNIGWPASRDEDVLAAMARLGYLGLEVAPTRVVESEPYAHAGEAARYAQRVRAEHGLAVPSMQSIWRGVTGNVFDPADREALIDYTAWAMAFAQAIGCRNMVFGCPKNRIVPEGSSPADADGFFLACAELAVRHGVTLALEANPAIYGTNFLNSTRQVYGYLERLGFPRGLSINLDAGAMLCERETADSVAAYLPHVSHVHISAPHLAAVEPDPLYPELKRVLCDFGYAGFVSLEMGAGDPASLARSLEYVAEVFA